MSVSFLGLLFLFFDIIVSMKKGVTCERPLIHDRYVVQHMVHGCMFPLIYFKGKLVLRDLYILFVGVKYGYIQDKFTLFMIQFNFVSVF